MPENIPFRMAKLLQELLKIPTLYQTSMFFLAKIYSNFVT